MAKEWTHEAFEAYVKRLESEASRDPEAYKRKVVGWIALGYAYIALLLTGTLLLLILIGYAFIASHSSGGLIKIAIVLLLFAATLVRSLWIKVTPPEGLALSRDDAPELFASAERLGARMDAPPFAQILLTSEFNAAAAQVPRLGIFGWPKNYLVVGMPLMQALSPEQFESVLAHELGHLRGGHGAFGSKVYRVQATWDQLSNSGAGLLRSFAAWYFPRISAYTFPLRRQNEYEADRGAADAAGARVAADALCLLPIRGQQLDRTFWEPLGRRIFQEDSAPRHVFTQLGQMLRETPLDPDAAQKALRDAMREDTTYADSHPALKDRLAALKEPARVPETASASAAERFFGPNLPRLTETLDRTWHERSAEAWRSQHANLAQQQGRFAALDARVLAGEALTDDERYEHASGVEALRSPEEALPLYRALFDTESLAAHARYDAGKILLARDDPEGATLLEDAMARRPALAEEGLALLRAYHKRVGDEAAAQAAHTRALRHADRLEEAAAERSQVTPKDTLVAHSLSTDALAELQRSLYGISELGEAFLLEKKMAHFAEEGPFLILAIALKKKLRTNEESDIKALYSIVDAKVPMVVLPIFGGFAWLRQRVSKLPESRIWPPG